MCRWFESNRGSQEELSFSVPLFSLVRKDGQKSATPPAGPERRHLATVRWTVATAVALPQQSESNRGSQKRTGASRFSFSNTLSRAYSCFGQASYWLPDLRADEGHPPLCAGRKFLFILAIQRIHIFCPAQMRKKTESPKII